MPEFIGHVLDHDAQSVTFEDRGDNPIPKNEHGVPDIEAVDIPPLSVPHYTDSFEAYEVAMTGTADFLRDREIRLANADGSVQVLKSYEEVVPTCEAVDKEYATVERRLQIVTGNDELQLPKLKPELVHMAYISLMAGGAVILPTFVGNIVASASPRGLSTMFAIKERPLSKPGVVLTTPDMITEIAEMPDGWSDYPEYMAQHGILIGSKLLRNPEHPLIKDQPEWSQQNSSQDDGTSMFVILPGKYSDAPARLLVEEGRLLTASSANKSGEGNNRNLLILDPDVPRGADYAASDQEAIDVIPLDEKEESQGAMVKYGLDENGEPVFEMLRMGFLQTAVDLLSRRFIIEHPELGIAGHPKRWIVHAENVQGSK